MSSKIRNHSKNDINAIVYSIFMIVWVLIVSILAKYFGILPFINGMIWAATFLGVRSLVKTIIGIYYKNLYYLFNFKDNIWIFICCIVVIIAFYTENFKYTLDNESLDKFRENTYKNIANYSDEELKKIIILNSSIMTITGILYIIILKIFTNNYYEYLDNVNSNNNYRKYSFDERKATFISTTIAWILLCMSYMNIRIVYKTKIYINGFSEIIIVNSIYGIISLLLVNIGIHKKNISLIKNYKKIPWNQSLIDAYILCMILYIIKSLFYKKFKSFDSKITVLIVVSNIIHLYFLKKFPSYLDKCTNNIVEKINHP